MSEEIIVRRELIKIILELERKYIQESVDKTKILKDLVKEIVDKK